MDAVQQSKDTMSSAGKTVAEQQVQKAQVVKTPSIKETLNKINTIGKEDEGVSGVKENVVSHDNTHYRKEKITQEELNSQFELFFDKIKKDQPRLHSAMKNQPAVLTENGSVEVFFQNHAQLEEFRQRLKPSLISHICNSLGIAEIDLQEQVVEAEKLTKPKLFSDSERFKQLSDKNPALLKLKNTFSLDFE